MNHQLQNELSDWSVMTSAIGNAKFSGLSLEDLWQAISLSKTPTELDVAIEAAILLKNIKAYKE